MGSGMFLPPNSNLILGHALRNQQGMASSLMGAIRNVGMVIGVAAFETVASMTIYQEGQTTAIHEISSPEILTMAFHNVMLLGVLFCIIAVILSASARDAEDKSDQEIAGI